MRRKKNQGFTLVELLISVALVAILAVVGIPSYNYYLQTHRLIGATNSLYYSLQLARSEAIKRNTTVYVAFNTGTNWCYGISTGAACSCSAAGSCNIASASSAQAQGLTMSATGLSGGAVHFESNHGAAGATSTVTFTVTGQTTSMSVTISLLGSVQICSNSVTGYQTCS